MLGSSQSSVHDAHVTDTEGARFQHLLDSNTIKSMTRRRSSFSVFSKLDSSREVSIRDVLEVFLSLISFRIYSILFFIRILFCSILFFEGDR